MNKKASTLKESQGYTVLMGKESYYITDQDKKDLQEQVKLFTENNRLAEIERLSKDYADGKIVFQQGDNGDYIRHKN